MNTDDKGRKTLLFVDYENVGKIDLSVIPENVQVMVFFGALQKSVPTEFMRAVHRMGSRFVPVDIEGQGRNALDFHIAYYLGEQLAANPHADCIVLSKDKGFDVLVKHLKVRSFKVRSAASIAEAFPRPSPKVANRATAPAPNAAIDGTALEQTLEWLKSTQARTRPRKRKGLVAHLHNHFGQKIPESGIEQLVAALIARKAISEAAGKLAYHL